ncbi:flagellar basal-body MS-ring/collar protein FliF [Rariglobus hedericola]|uniref:Flagellar M-ring protein n=1 Tax=Rariglobus hedericola TaxID=2597822 RepID=A0A556QPV4_9BACT|nr:flagellar basal-body MS-ring/collar protein FliF [Rariglobus hedericola]TSJ78659.1 flagellar M-ring protein FliF [Rariglobus hedericola]
MKAFTQSLLGLWTQLGINQRVTLVVAAAAVVAGLIGVVLWSHQPDYQLLYGKLSEKDSSQIIAQLQAQNIPHKIANGGNTIYVPADRVHRLRMDLAGKGVPSGEGVGFEIFDKGQFGLSDFVQRTNYLRALQGELARTISQLDGVRSARVMIVQPENRLLVTNQSVKPTASVFVELTKPRLEPEAVNSIRNLVANAVQGLLIDQVAVVDQKGRVLSEDLKQDPTLASASSQMRYRQQIEDYLAKKVETMLLPVVGAGNTVVRVSAEIETESTTRTEEKYDPDGQVVRSQTQTEDISNSSEQRSGGSTGVAANTPEKAGAEPAASRPSNITETNRKNRTTSYEINRTLTNTSRQPGAIRNVTAAVFVAQRYAPVPAGAAPGTEPVAQIRTPEEIQALRKIVINALGLKAVDGQSLDSLVSLQELPFLTEPVSAQIQQIQSETRIQSWIETVGAYLPIGVGALVLFFFVRMLSRQKPEPVPIELLSVPAAAGGASLGSNGHSVLTPDMLNQLIQQKPANIGNALRDYMAVKKN